MVELTPLDWALWLAVICAECGLVSRMLRKGAAWRWRSVFLFLTVLSFRDIVRLVDRLAWHNPALSFYSFWSFSLLAEAVEVWIIVQIGLELVGVSPWTRRLVCQGIPLVAATIATVTTASAFHDEMLPAYAKLCYVVVHVDQGISFAWLGVFLGLALPIELVGVQWSGGVRGIAVGFALELIATSSTQWLTLSGVDPSLLANIKSVIFLVSLLIWGVSLNPRKRTEYGHVLPQVKAYLESFTRIFDKEEV